jgi:hypothetical protein
MSRRDALKCAAATPALIGLVSAAESLRAPSASAYGLGVLLDYAAGVIPADQIRAAGAVGSIRYVSDRRPGGAWMLGKPMQINEARDLHQNGLKIVSCYQYGQEASADWLGGQSAGVQHATRGWQLHTAAGGPANVPIYASIDDDPSFEQYQAQVAPYLRGWESVVGHQRTGVYGNSQDDRMGAARRPGLVLLAAQLGLAGWPDASCRPSASGRDRQAPRWRRRGGYQ